MRDRPVLRTLKVAAVAVVLLTACKRQAAVPALSGSSVHVARLSAPSGEPARRIAVSHRFMVDLPGADVERTQRETLAGCDPPGCWVLATHIGQTRDGAVQASISVRIAPERYAGFAAAITAPPARLTSHTESAEDKTLAVLDIEKRLDAQMVLRDRLMQLLKQSGTSIGDMVAVEKQLADVQGTIESETAQRDYLRTITDTVMVEVSYNGLIQQAGPFDVSPLLVALEGFAGIVIQSVGDMIAWFAYALPWLAIVVLAGWAGRRLLRRQG